MNFKELNDRVLKWADDKCILKDGTPYDQIQKTKEEVEETELAIIYKRAGAVNFFNQSKKLCRVNEEIKDGFGDILVTILIGCKMQGLDPLDCLKTALNVIEKRSGKMVNGKFEKDE